MQRKWWKESAIYQIYPKSFCDSNGDGIGDIGGIISKLDYLKDLGVGILWLSPIYKSPGFDNGYDISDYYSIAPEYGTMEDFDQLIEEAHRRDLRIVMDLVVNHTSDEHPWFLESKSSLDNPRRDYYIWRDPVDEHAPNNWGQCFGARSAWTYHEKTGQYYFHAFSEKQIDLNWENPALRREIYDMMIWWCEKGVDGFRMDVIDLISKAEGMPDFPVDATGYAPMVLGCADGPHVHEYLQEMRREVLDKYDVVAIGECPALTPEKASNYVNLANGELDLLFQFEHVDLDGDWYGKWCAEPMDLPTLKRCLANWQTTLHGNGWNSLYFCNHDQPRVVSRLGDDSTEYREKSAKCIATFLYHMQGTPDIYEGEELGMTNYIFTGAEEFEDIESVNAYRDLLSLGLSPKDAFRRVTYKCRDNARTAMQWSSADNAGFTQGWSQRMINPNYTEINAAEQVEREDSVFAYYKELLSIRKSGEYRDLIVYGDFTLLLEDDPDLFAYERHLGERSLMVVANVSANEHTIVLPEGHMVLSNRDDVQAGMLTLGAWDAFVWEIGQ